MPYFVKGKVKYANGKGSFKINERYNTLSEAKDAKHFLRGEKVRIVHIVRGKAKSFRRKAKRHSNDMFAINLNLGY